MFNLIPFGGSRWEVGNMDFHLGFICQLLDIVFPEPYPAAIAPSAIASDIKTLGVWKCILPNTAPPLSHTFPGELGSVMTDAKM